VVEYKAQTHISTHRIVIKYGSRSQLTVPYSNAKS